jgi:hypothetical protein
MFDTTQIQGLTFLMVAGVDNARSPVLAATPPAPPAPPPPVRQHTHARTHTHTHEDQKGSEHARMGTRWQEEMDKDRGDGARGADGRVMTSGPPPRKFSV